MKRTKTLAIAALGASLALSACGSGDDSESKTTEAASDTAEAGEDDATSDTAEGGEDDATSDTAEGGDEAAETGGGDCSEPTEVTWLGTIKVEIQDQFKAAIDDYNATNTDCVNVTILEASGETFLQSVTPMYEAGEAPTIMTALQELPDMADKVMDWNGQPLTELAQPGTLDVANIDGKQVGLPVTAEAFGLLYNKAVLDGAGVDGPAVTSKEALTKAFADVQASGPAAMHFSGLWWSLGAHFTNIYHTNAADTVEGRDEILEKLKAGEYKLMDDPVYVEWLDMFDMFKENNIDTASIADEDYDVGVEDLASGAAGYWFMGNWAEPNLLEAAPDTEFGVAPVPLGAEGSYGADAISVGVPFYMIVDIEQSTPEQQQGAIDVITWFLTTPEGQAHWAGPIEDNGMSFIPVYKDFTVEPTTFMAKEIAQYIADGKTLEWVNSKYPSGLQECYGEATQKYYDGVSDRDTLAADMEACWTAPSEG